jgi:hypothetical protein
MTRTHGSGGYQGAISSMLAVADVCPGCGKLIAEHRRFSYANSGSCPDMVLGAFPFIDDGATGRFDADDPSSSSPATSPNGFPTSPDETATGVFAGPRPVGRPRRSDLLAMTWNLAHGSEDFP